MDALTAKRIGELQNIVMQESIKLIQGKLDVVFFDATTFHFCQEFDDDDFPLESVADSKKEKEAPRLPLDGLEETQPLDAPKEEAQEEEPPEESTSLDAIGLRQKGYSKNGRQTKTQVVMAFIQTKDGLPLGDHLFAGNTADVATLKPVIDGNGMPHSIALFLWLMPACDAKPISIDEPSDGVMTLWPLVCVDGTKSRPRWSRAHTNG